MTAADLVDDEEDQSRTGGFNDAVINGKKRVWMRRTFGTFVRMLGKGVIK